jgi:aspartyl-tRNA(Asn)/glutamyl-tRNA(Gln) amidotransferase subunit C
MDTRLSHEEVRRIAALAHLALTEAEVELFSRQLATILEYAAQVRDLDTSAAAANDAPAAPPVADRADVVRPSLPRDDALANAPDRASDNSLFRVPRVIG